MNILWIIIFAFILLNIFNVDMGKKHRKRDKFRKQNNITEPKKITKTVPFLSEVLPEDREETDLN